MVKSDRFLIGIVAGILLILVVSFVVALRGRSPASYQPEDTPEGVAYNYLLALQQEDYEQAYGYLSPTLAGYPADLTQFIDDIRHRRPESSAMAVQRVEIRDDAAWVDVELTVYYGTGGLFDSGQYSRRFEMRLEQQGADWRIREADDFWNDCWHRPDRTICR